MAQKKCSSCGKWNDKLSPTCGLCGELLDLQKKEQVRLKKLGRLPVKQEESALFEIKQEYPLWRKIILSILRPIYILFMIIAGFFVWLAAWVSA